MVSKTGVRCPGFLALCGLALAGLLVLSVRVAEADTLRLRDGSVLVGQIERMVDQKMTVRTASAGELTIPFAEVMAFETEKAKPVHLTNGTVLEGTLRFGEDGMLQVIRADGGPRTVSTSDLEAIDLPRPPETPSVAWNAELVGNLAVTDGNSDTKALGLSGHLQRRTEEDRATLRGGYHYSEDQDRSSRDDQFASAKYDYFFQTRWFGYLNGRFDRDVIKKLKNRTSVGVGTGYQFLETERLKMFGEGGLSGVRTRYQNGTEDADYPAARVAFNAEWWIIKDQLRFTENAEALFRLDDTDGWLAISETGLSWHLTDKWSAQAGIRYEYDNAPARGEKQADTKYSLGIGYSL